MKKPIIIALASLPLIASFANNGVALRKISFDTAKAQKKEEQPLTFEDTSILPYDDIELTAGKISFNMPTTVKVGDYMTRDYYINLFMPFFTFDEADDFLQVDFVLGSANTSVEIPLQYKLVPVTEDAETYLYKKENGYYAIKMDFSSLTEVWEKMKYDSNYVKKLWYVKKLDITFPEHETVFDASVGTTMYYSHYGTILAKEYFNGPYERYEWNEDGTIFYAYTDYKKGRIEPFDVLKNLVKPLEGNKQYYHSIYSMPRNFGDFYNDYDPVISGNGKIYDFQLRKLEDRYPQNIKVYIGPKARKNPKVYFKGRQIEDLESPIVETIGYKKYSTSDQMLDHLTSSLSVEGAIGDTPTLTLSDDMNFIPSYGKRTVTCRIEEFDNRVTTFTIELNFVDDVPPEVSVKEQIIKVPARSKMDEVSMINNIIATDEIDGDNLDITIESNSYYLNQNWNKVGVYPITISVTDKAGNKAYCTFNIEVMPLEDKHIVLQEEILIGKDDILTPSDVLDHLLGKGIVEDLDYTDVIFSNGIAYKGENEVGETLVTLEAKSVDGSTSYITLQVEVKDDAVIEEPSNPVTVNIKEEDREEKEEMSFMDKIWMVLLILKRVLFG